MTKRKAFNFYNSHWLQIKLLNDRQKLELYNAICQVQFLEINIEDIEFSDPISNIVWTGIKHSIQTSLNGFITKQIGLKKDLIIPLAKGIKNPMQAPYVAPCQEEEEKGQEKGQEKEEVKEPKTIILSSQELNLKNIIFKAYSFNEMYFNQQNIAITKFCQKVNIEHATNQIKSYFEYNSKDNNKFRVTYSNLIGSEDLSYNDGVWNKENWTDKLKNVNNIKSNGDNDRPLTAKEALKRHLEWEKRQEADKLNK